MKKYIGNCSEAVNWNEVLQCLSQHQPEKHGYNNPYGIDHDYHDIDPLHLKGIETYKDRQEAVEFFTYVNGKEYSMDVNSKFAEWLGCKPFLSWISRIDPGRCVPPHIDYDDVIMLEEAGIPEENWVRYHCHISEPEIGAVLMLEDGSSYHMEKQGDVFQWPSVKSVHSGMNAGWKSKYLFNFIGIID